MFGAVLCVFVLIVLFFVWRKYTHFSRRGLSTLTIIPPFGNFHKSLLMQEHARDDINRVYNAYSNQRFAAMYQFLLPIVLIREPELIKEVLVREFEFFDSHQATLDEEHEPLFGRSLLALKGQKWRAMRSTISPAFTSSKLRHMVQFVSECSKNLTFHVDALIKGNKGSIDIECKGLCTRFTSDVIATSVFGVEVDSFKDPNNEFYLMGKEATDFDGLKFLKAVITLILPSLTKALGLTIFSDEVTDFFRNLVQGTMKNRDMNGIHRPDMIQLLMEARKGVIAHDKIARVDNLEFSSVDEAEIKHHAKQTWCDDDFTAQAVLFFLGGFETSSTVMCFTLHELAINLEVQERLSKEILNASTTFQNNLTLDEIQKLKYLDMVVSESLRKWSPNLIGDRKASRDYDLGPVKYGGSKTYTVKEAETIWFPINAIHHDPKYWENPEKFDPERFSEEGKKKIKPYTYLPFGAAPRNCIGSRYALMMVKVLLCQLLSEFRFDPCAETQIPMKLSPKSFILKPVNGFWLRISTRVGDR